ncbi:MAG: NAD(P)-dependent oxidoreductase, partial [Anaerohalosphaeraceae bacterium]
MKITLYSNKPYTQRYFEMANKAFGQEITYLEQRLGPDTAELAKGCQAVCVFVNDVLDAPVLTRLAELGVRLIALRCAGFNNVELDTAEKLGLSVVRVPAYSPYAVAEHAIALILALNRCTHKAHARVREGNFSLEGLLGFDMYQTPVGIVGTGKIGAI